MFLYNPATNVYKYVCGGIVMNISENIRKYRKELKMTQQELADKIGVQVLAIKQWENGKYEPTIKNVRKMCEIFGVSAQVLCGLEEPDFIFKSEDKEFLVELSNAPSDIMKEMKNYYEYLKSK